MTWHTAYKTSAEPAALNPVLLTYSGLRMFECGSMFLTCPNLSDFVSRITAGYVALTSSCEGVVEKMSAGLG